MEFAKFIFKFNNKMLPESFDCYFTKLDNIHKHNTRQNIAVNIINFILLPNQEKNSSVYLLKCVEKYTKRVLSLFIFTV